MSNPTCPCANPNVVQSSALGKAYWYCRGCKAEVVTEGPAYNHVAAMYEREVTRMAGVTAADIEAALKESTERMLKQMAAGAYPITVPSDEFMEQYRADYPGLTARLPDDIDD